MLTFEMKNLILLIKEAKKCVKDFLLSQEINK